MDKEHLQTCLSASAIAIILLAYFYLNLLEPVLQTTNMLVKGSILFGVASVFLSCITYFNGQSATGMKISFGSAICLFAVYYLVSEPDLTLFNFFMLIGCIAGVGFVGWLDHLAIREKHVLAFPDLFYEQAAESRPRSTANLKKFCDLNWLRQNAEASKE